MPQSKEKKGSNFAVSCSGAIVLQAQRAKPKNMAMAIWQPLSHSLLLCLLLGSSSTSVVLMAAKQAALRFLFPSLPLLPSILILLLHSSFERSGNLLIPNGIVSLQASALHGPRARRQTWPRARARARRKQPLQGNKVGWKVIRNTRNGCWLCMKCRCLLFDIMQQLAGSGPGGGRVAICQRQPIDTSYTTNSPS